jgi:hypothetical protein
MDFKNLAAKAGELLDQHGDKVEDAVGKAGDFAKSKIDGHDNLIDTVVQKTKDAIPGGE